MATMNTFTFRLAIVIFSILSTINFAAGKRKRRHIDDFEAASWNMQGAFTGSSSKWADVIRPAMQLNNPRRGHAIDVLALQESGSLPGSSSRLLPEDEAPVRHIAGGAPWLQSHVTQSMYPITRSGIVQDAFVYHNQWNAQHNVALLSNTQADEVIVVDPTIAEDRPAIGIRIGQDYFFSLHARPFGDDNEAPEIVHQIEVDMGRNLNQHPEATWIIMGDYNREPHTLQAGLERLERDAPAPANVHRQIIDTHSMTQTSGGNLDYAVTGSGNENQGNMHAYIHAENGMFSDHVGVIFLAAAMKRSVRPRLHSQSPQPALTALTSAFKIPVDEYEPQMSIFSAAGQSQ